MKNANARRVSPNEIDDLTNATKDCPEVIEYAPETVEDFTSSTEDVPNAAKNAEIVKDTEHNSAINENQQNDDVRNSISGGAHPDEILAADQIDVVMDDSIKDNVDDVSEATDSEHTKSEEFNGAINIPTVGSVDSNDTNYLSSSDVCSLSSWRENKCLPSLTTVSDFLENETFSENMKDIFVDCNAQIGTGSGSSNDSHALHNACDLDMNSRPRSGYRDSQKQTVEGEMDLRNSISQTESTTSSIRSGEPTDTEDCEASSESMSSISTTNSNERPKLVDNHPKEHFGAQFETSSCLNDQIVSKSGQKHDQNGVGEDQLSQLNSKSPTNNTVPQNGFPSKDDFQNNKACKDETDTYHSMENSRLNCTEDCPNEMNVNGNIDNGTNFFAIESMQVNPRDVNDSQSCDDATDAGHKFQPTESVGGQSSSVGKRSNSVGAQSEDVGEKSDVVDGNSKSVGGKSGNSGARSEVVVSRSENSVTDLGNVSAQSENVGNHSESDGEQPGGVDPETRAKKSESVETKKCSLCKENVAVDELVTFALDVAEQIELKYLHCWRSGVCFSHPDLFLVVVYRPQSDCVVVEVAVSPNSLGRRLLTFVVDHLDTLIKEWYPGLLTSYGTEATVQKRIPCRSCEKDGKRKPHIFSFDYCVTQISMANFVKCPEHEVSIGDIAPDVVLQDIDPDLLLQEDELEYETSDANMIGKGRRERFTIMNVLDGP